MNNLQWIILFALLFIIFNVWNSNKRIDTTEAAPVGKFSSSSNYKNITAMKHDIFKQLTLDIFPFILVNNITSIGSAEFFSISDFENSIFGKSLLSGVAYALFYQIIQPSIINRTPIF